MVPVLIAVVVLVGVVCLLDLVLTIGVIRRLREHTLLLSSPRGFGNMPALAEVGQEIAEFETTTADGQSIDRSQLSGETLVGFFTPRCQPCKEKLPDFVEFARSMPGGRERSFAAVVGDGDEAAEMVAALRPVAQVSVEGQGGPMTTAFQVKAFPTVVKVAPDGEGRVVVVNNEVPLDRPGVLTA